MQHLTIPGPFCFVHSLSSLSKLLSSPSFTPTATLSNSLSCSVSKTLAFSDYQIPQMQAKRSRTVRSTSFGDASLLNQVLPPPATVSPELRLNVRNSSEIPAFATPSKFTAESDQYTSGILTLASADIEDESPEEHIGNFLEKCYYCKRGIAEGAEVFMYSYLRAFCTSECRANQITMDKLREKGFGQSVESKTQSGKMRNGAQSGKMKNAKLFHVQV